MSIIYLEAPTTLHSYTHIDPARTVFLAGSITGASDWQLYAASVLLKHFSVFNPRRADFNVSDSAVEREQIAWEYRHLDIAGITLFYFAPDTLAPITLLEYGKQLVKSHYAPWRKTYVHIHPEYKRKTDVVIQTELANPRALARFYSNLDDMYNAIITENSIKSI